MSMESTIFVNDSVDVVPYDSLDTANDSMNITNESMNIINDSVSIAKDSVGVIANDSMNIANDSMDVIANDNINIVYDSMDITNGSADFAYYNMDTTNDSMAIVYYNIDIANDSMDIAHYNMDIANDSMDFAYYNMEFANDSVDSIPNDDYDNYLYHGYSFERPVYLYIWEILVIVTCLVNCVVISVLLRKKIRNPTYIILVAISISDSLTGLVTLPTYMAVFQHVYSVAERPDETLITTTYSHEDFSMLSDEDQDYADFLNSNVHETEQSSLTLNGYFLSEELCDGFMISKFFLSKSFHTISVWLTMFLALQRFMAVYGNYGRIRDRFTLKNTIIMCVVVCALAPFLHVYHLFNDKSQFGYCEWTVETGKECDSDCIYLWCVMVLGHLLPAMLLIVFTLYFVYSIKHTTDSIQKIGSTRANAVNTGLLSRQRENRRISRVVNAILIVFLIPEVPYAGFLLYTAIVAHADINMNLKANRAIHAAYEILLILSFNANFYIYTFFNKRFRKVLKETILLPVYTVICSAGKLFGYTTSPENSTNVTSEGGDSTEMTGFIEKSKEESRDKAK